MQKSNVKNTDHKASSPLVDQPTIPFPMKEITLRLPEYLADLIEETKGQLKGQWEEAIGDLAADAVEIRFGDFNRCAQYFEEIFVDGSWTFEGAEDRSRFVAPLRIALGKAHDRRHALPKDPTGEKQAIA